MRAVSLDAPDGLAKRSRVVVGKGGAMLAGLRMLPDAWRDRLLLKHDRRPQGDAGSLTRFVT